MNWKFIVINLQEKMTQQEIARLSGCSQPFISLLSRGKRASVDYETGQKLIHLCAANGISIYEKKKAPVVRSN